MIEVQGLTYTYPGANPPAVSNVSFTVSPGEIFGLLGPSGAGKSTVQRVLTRQNRRFHGEARVLSRKLEDWDHTFYEHIGVGFELPNHYPRLTGLENLAFFASLYPGSAQAPDDLLETVGLAGAANVRVRNYSKGTQTRLNFARAVLHRPAVLFLDEPTAGLDPVNAAVIKDLIRSERNRGTTVLLTTHNMTDVDELCDRVGFLVDGRMGAAGIPAELKARYGRRSVRVAYEESTGSIATAEFPLDGLARHAAFIELMDARRVHAIHSQEATLDRVFAEVTGVRLVSSTDG